MFQVVVYISSVCLALAASAPIDAGLCDLSEAQKCIGTATELIPTIYFNPLNRELLTTIKDQFCGIGLENCIQSMDVSNCSKTSVAPYLTVINTVSFVCHTGLTVESSCLGSNALQRWSKFCSQMFKVVVDNTIGDPTLSFASVNKGLCGAYDDTKSCTMNNVREICDVRGQAFVGSLLDVSSRASRDALGC